MTGNFPLLTIGIITYARPVELMRTVEALHEHITYPRECLRWVIADDSSPDGYVAKLKRQSLFKEIGAEFISTPERGGWGRNTNHLLNHVGTDSLLYQTEDDYVLRKPLDLRVGAALLETRTNIGLLRYRGVAGEHMIAHQFESDISEYLPDYQDGVGLSGRVNYWQLDSGSSALYLYSHGPHLKRPSFHLYHGLYYEGLKLGQSEEFYAHKVKDSMKTDWQHAPAIAILSEWMSLHYDHIGVSYQHGELDR